MAEGGTTKWFLRDPPKWLKLVVVGAFVVSLVTTVLLLVTCNEKGVLDLWKLPGQSRNDLDSLAWAIPEPASVERFLLLDRLLISSTTITLLLGVLMGSRASVATSSGESLRSARFWRTVAAALCALLYLIADDHENGRLRTVSHEIAVEMPRSISHSDAIWMARFYDAKWLLLVSAVLLTISLWNRHVPPRPGRTEDTWHKPEDWGDSDGVPLDHTGVRVHDWDPSDTRFGISVSGGGIRSASFAFGVLEVLRSESLLERARYVTSASGGSYATCALERANRHLVESEISTETAALVAARELAGSENAERAAIALHIRGMTWTTLAVTAAGRAIREAASAATDAQGRASKRAASETAKAKRAVAANRDAAATVVEANATTVEARQRAEESAVAAAEASSPRGLAIHRNETTVRLRRRLNYLVPTASAGVGAVVRMVLGVLVNLVILYCVIFAVAKPIGWLIGTPVVQRGLRLERPYVIEIVRRDDDPDPTTKQVWQDDCELKRDPGAPLTARFGGPHQVGGRRLVPLAVAVPTQCVRIREPSGAEAYWTYDVAAVGGLVAVARDNTVSVVRQPTVESHGLRRVVPIRTESASDVAARPTAKDLVKLDFPDVEVSASVILADGTSIRSSIGRIVKPLGSLDVTSISLIDRRAGLDIDTKDVALPLVTGSVAAILWIIAGRTWIRLWLQRHRATWWGMAFRALPPVAVGLALLLAAVLLLLPWLVDAFPATLVPRAASDGATPAATGLAATLPPLVTWPIAAVGSILGFFKSNKPASAAKPAQRSAKALIGKLLGILRNIVVAFALLSAALVSALSIMTVAALNGPFGSNSWLSAVVSKSEVPWPDDVVVWTIVMVALMLAAAWFPAGSWSLGSYYRERLRWAFTGRDLLGDRLDGVGPDGVPNPGTGYIDGREFDGTELVLCATANVLGPNRGPAGRRAVSFTASRSWIGGPEVGWVETHQYIDELGPNRRRDVTITAMMAVSGAAVSPAMGKLSLGPIGSIFAILNVRLGSWLPHPVAVKEHRRLRESGRSVREWRHTPGWPYFVREVFRRHRHESPYLYVTDGGHWENLGLVEALRRGCNTIIAISASGDGAYSHETFAEAVEIARTDLGIHIVMDDIWKMRPTAGGETPSTLPSGRQLLFQAGDEPTLGRVAPFGYTFGTFTGPDDRSGMILLVEATMVDGLDVDVHAYAEHHTEFPDVNTGDQFFTNRDFDAYRMLGRSIVSTALETDPGRGLRRDIDRCTRREAPSVAPGS